MRFRPVKHIKYLRNNSKSWSGACIESSDWISDDQRRREANTRIKKKFLFFPKTIQGERRWWERVKIKQEFDFGMWGIDSDGWEDVAWA